MNRRQNLIIVYSSASVDESAGSGLHQIFTTGPHNYDVAYSSVPVVSDFNELIKVRPPKNIYVKESLVKYLNKEKTNLILWKPSQDQLLEQKSPTLQINKFIQQINIKFSLNLNDYSGIYEWSIKNPSQFWEQIWIFFQLIYSQEPDTIFERQGDFFQTSWFPGAKLNFAQNLLKFRDEKIALVFWNELGKQTEITYSELFQQAIVFGNNLQKLGVTTGDRVAAILPNIPEAIIAMLGTTMLGAIWSSVSPEFGENAIIDRFAQIKPKVLVVSNGYVYKKQNYVCLDRTKTILASLPSVKHTIYIDYPRSSPILTKLSSLANELPIFPQLDFDHPLCILFSSGTTGKPKCIVHGAGRVLLEHLKELVLHTNLTREDTIFYQTSTSWMMWNWLVSSLAVGSKIVLYDGSPLENNAEILWEMAEKEQITIFGTNARYLSLLQKNNFLPKEKFNLKNLKTILSTGSPLLEENFDYVHSSIKADVQLSSISGGTDILGCFALGCPILPVIKGELQCRSLGLAVDVFNEKGIALKNQQGELVCKAPFPSMPLYFWDDPNFEKYKAAYFNKFENVWCHGDNALITASGGVVIYGRSDTTLNPGGVRIGTAEIYNIVLSESFPEIVDCLVVGKEIAAGDQKIFLFVKLLATKAINAELKTRICTQLKEKASRYHVPKYIIQVPDIPRTHNNKIAEKAVWQIVNGKTEEKELGAIANPECLQYFKL